MTPRDLEARVQELEDIEAIKKLQNAYCYYLQHWEEEEIIGLFSKSPDTSLETGGGGLYKGEEGIRQYFSFQTHFHSKLTKAPPEFLHQLMPLCSIVDVDPDGKTAKGRWYGLGENAIPEGGNPPRAMFTSGIWENEFVKEDGKWKFKKIVYSGTFATPWEDGWVKNPIPRGPVKPRAKELPPSSPEYINRTYPTGRIFPYHYKNPVTGK